MAQTNEKPICEEQDKRQRQKSGTENIKNSQITLLAGRKIKKKDLTGKKKVIMVTDKVVEAFFAPYYRGNDDYEITRRQN